MKKTLSAFFLRGLTASVGGPVILAIVYLSLGSAGTVESLPAGRIAGEILTSALLAFIAGGVSVVYQIDRLSLLSATLLHGAALYLDYILFYLLNGWIPRRPASVAVFTGIFLAAYAVIWLIVYCIIRRRVAGLNRRLAAK